MWKNGLYQIVEENSDEYVSMFKVYLGAINVSKIYASSLKERDKIALMLNGEVATIEFEDNDIEVVMTDEGIEQAMLDILEVYLKSGANDEIVIIGVDSILKDFDEGGTIDRYEFMNWVKMILSDSRVKNKKSKIERIAKGLWW